METGTIAQHPHVPVRVAGGESAQAPQKGTAYQAAVYYKEEVHMQFSNSDGDVFEMSYRTEAAGVLAYDGSGKDASSFASQIEKFMGQVEEFVEQQKQRMLDFLVNHSGFFGDNENSSKPFFQGVGDNQSFELPEYWSPENTSERIVNFALSFFDGSKMDAEAYAEKISKAVEAGFSQAREILGKLPDGVNGVVKDTERLTFEKIDAWAARQSEASLAA